jgi:hypothetical protein
MQWKDLCIKNMEWTGEQRSDQRLIARRLEARSQVTTSHFLNSEKKYNIIIAVLHDLPDLLPPLCEKRNGESAPWHGLDFPTPRFRFVFSLYLAFHPAIASK